jgi:hypothetical protein
MVLLASGTRKKLRLTSYDTLRSIQLLSSRTYKGIVVWDYSSMKTERPIAELIRGSEYMVSAV